MTFEDSKYFCFCFYSAPDLFKNKQDRLAIENSLTHLFQKLGIADLKQSAISRVGEFKYETIRKVKLKANPIEAIFDKISLAQDLNILIQSSNWTNEIAPNLIVNIFCSNTDKFNGRVIPENPKMFLIVAIGYEYVSDDILLLQEADIIFNQNNGIKGGIWRNTKYALSDGTPIPWAFNNFPGSSTTSTLEDWNPNFDQELSKTKANNV